MMKSLILAAFMIASFAPLAFAQREGGGTSTGNGGKGPAAALSDAIVTIDQILADECAKLKQPTPTEIRACQVEPKLFEAIMKAKIDVQYIVYGKIDHKPRDAVNDTLNTGESFVTFSMKRLQEMTPDLRRRVILHEFLTLAGFESSDSYGYSTLVLKFLMRNEAMNDVLSKLPLFTNTEKTFRGVEVMVSDGQKAYAVALQSVNDYTRFCIANGFDRFTTIHLIDLSYKEWVSQNRIENGLAKLSDDGSIIEVDPKPASSVRVIQSVNCK